jgi:hypothetical protein
VKGGHKPFLEKPYDPLSASLPDMPLFLQSERYITVTLETTYGTAYQGMPAFWRNVLESGRAG